ncbi:hypothetical protein P5673_016629 [Acropora cervicornis]|uniref:Uncharacterized protein n=1 Tax=Acropora cervicornis TaxID=6130 RepID=A0AAD9V4D3_ACRCE|nr:hypothetical protein P5673_016629 [Acropora cervicornis]
MAAVEPVDELKECLRASVEMLLDKLNDRLHEDMDYISQSMFFQVDLNSLDYIAIGVSLTLAIVILVFLIVFYYLAQRRTAAGGNIKEMGQKREPSSSLFATARRDVVRMTNLLCVERSEGSCRAYKEKG